MAQPLPRDFGAPLTLREWADDDSLPGEFHGGRRTDEEVPTQLHEAIVTWLIVLFDAWLNDTGAVYASETKFAVSADKGRKPDVSVFLEGTVPSRNASLISTPPFIAVEVLSPLHRDQIRDRIDKLFEYAAFGVRFYWLVDPDLRAVTIYELGDDGRYVVAFAASAGQHPAPGCEGLVLDLDALWKRVDRLPE